MQTDGDTNVQCGKSLHSKFEPALYHHALAAGHKVKVRLKPHPGPWRVGNDVTGLVGEGLSVVGALPDRGAAGAPAYRAPVKPGQHQCLARPRQRAVKRCPVPEARRVRWSCENRTVQSHQRNSCAPEERGGRGELRPGLPAVLTPKRDLSTPKKEECGSIFH